MKSENFNSSYCIFVNKVPNTVVQKISEYKSSAIKVLKAQFKEDLFCIVMPTHYPFKSYETELFKLYDGVGSGFWGQFGMGYVDKDWEVFA